MKGELVMANIDVEKVDALVAFVREYNTANDGEGCPRGVMQHVGKFNPAVIKFAHDTGVLEVRKGAGGGSWPAGEKPAPKTDGAESITSQAFDMILAFSRGHDVDRDLARNLWERREEMNAARRKA